ncbi:uncharacterized protein YxjI [Bacilli bacterium PM5-3]|nr:uncharacterized protein YxjI [Bacilli bacterium PM5-3]MDH6603922.1 uncharacterized protein YxjI [Bacilli bacterium PM5-9]
MKLYMKQRPFNLKGNFTIKDENENDVYYVEGKLFSIGKKYYLYDMEDNELAHFNEIFMSMLGKYEIYVNDELITTIENKFSLFKRKLGFSNLDWHIEGSISDHEFSVCDSNDVEIASLSKAWFTWGDIYVVDIVNPNDELLIIMVVLAIDVLNERRKVAVTST